jgi:hypothetical protein
VGCRENSDKERAVLETATFGPTWITATQQHREVPIAAVPQGNETDITQSKKIRQCEFSQIPFGRNLLSIATFHSRDLPGKNPLARH